jgi:hypothetical protein
MTGGGRSPVRNCRARYSRRHPMIGRSTASNPASTTSWKAPASRGVISTPAVAAASGRALEEVESTLTTMARQGQFVREAGPLEWPDGTRGALRLPSRCARRPVSADPPARPRTCTDRSAFERKRRGSGHRDRRGAGDALRTERRAGSGPISSVLQRTRQRGAYGEAQTHFDHALAARRRAARPGTIRTRARASDRTRRRHHGGPRMGRA